MELQIKPYEKAAPIEWNFEELKKELASRVEQYKTLQYTPEQIASAKTDRAALNSLKKALNDERIRREKEFMEPFNLFKAQVNELITLIDEPTKLIDKQIKEYEEKEKQDKREACILIFSNMDNIPEWLKFEQIENPKWLNKTFTGKAVFEEITEKISKINADIQIINELPEYSFEAMEVYKRTLDTSAAIAEGKRMADIQKQKEAAAKVAEKRIETAQIPFAPEEPIESTLAEEKTEEKAVWLSFKALLTASQAIELKAFCEFNKIQIKPM